VETAFGKYMEIKRERDEDRKKREELQKLRAAE